MVIHNYPHPLLSAGNMQFIYAKKFKALTGDDTVWSAIRNEL